MFIKICGLTTESAVDTCVDAAVDAVGFVFATRSVRYLEPRRAAELRRRVPADVESVGVFENATVDEVLAAASASGVGTVQLHGPARAPDLSRLAGEGLRVIQAISAREYAAADRSAQRPADIRLLIDADEPGAGVQFDDSIFGAARPDGFWILAGGLTPGNVADRVRGLRPDGVDVSSGVESSRGVKSLTLIREFTAAVPAI